MDTIKQLIDEKKYEEALSLIDQNLKQQPDKLEYLCAKADLMKKQNRLTDAINVYIHIIEKYPEYKRAQVEKDLIHTVLLQDNKDIFACTNLHDDHWDIM